MNNKFESKSEKQYVDNKSTSGYDKSIKSYHTPIESYQTEWSDLGEGIFKLGPKSRFPLAPNIYSIVEGMDGIQYHALDVITDDLLVLQNSITEKIMGVIEKFWNKKEVYEMFGQTYKFGILFYGVPGSGKTSVLNLLFKQLLSEDGLVFICKNPYLISQAIREVRKAEPLRNIIIVYEDIDEMFNYYGERQFLSIMEGQEQFDGVLHIATTNYIDRIPDRFKNRPGRFDEVVEMPLLNTSERKLFVEHLLRPVKDKSLIMDIVRDTEGFPMSHIREVIISVFILEKDYKETINKLKLMNGQEVDKSHHTPKEKCKDEMYRREHMEECK